MITKLRPRYYCEFCKKSGGSKYHMARHETGCTLNPNRACGMCAFAEHPQASSEDLIAAFAKDLLLPRIDDLMVSVNPVNLTEAAHGCPACMMSVIRKSGEFVAWDYEKLKSSFWNQINAERERHKYPYESENVAKVAFPFVGGEVVMVDVGLVTRQSGRGPVACVSVLDVVFQRIHNGETTISQRGHGAFSCSGGARKRLGTESFRHA